MHLHKSQHAAVARFPHYSLTQDDEMRQRELAELNLSQYYLVRANCSCKMNSEAHVYHMQSFV